MGVDELLPYLKDNKDILIQSIQQAKERNEIESISEGYRQNEIKGKRIYGEKQWMGK